MNSQKLWGVVLGASLTVNVFCIAALAALLVTSGQWRHGPSQMSSLPAEAQALFQEISLRQQPGFRQSIREVREQFAAVDEALMADPFDAQQLHEAFAALRQAKTASAELAHQRIAEVAASLTPDEREALAGMIGKHKRWMHFPRP